MTAAAPLLEAENAQVGQTITNQAVNDLPLATRDWGSLAQMSAGVTTTPTGSGGGGVTADAGSSESAYFRVNGVDEWQNDFRLNGINDNIEFYGGNYTLTNAAIVPPPDAMQEFTLQSGDFNAEFGHSTGGIVNAAIKSGTNGSPRRPVGVRAQQRSERQLLLQQNLQRLRPASPSPIPAYHQNLFGFTAGGPVMIPGVVNGKNRLFWFTDYQGGRYVLPEPDGDLTVPTMDMVNSNFTNLQDNITYNYSGTCSATVTTGCPNRRLGPRLLQRHHPRSGFNAPASRLRHRPGNRTHRHAQRLCARSFYNCTAAAVAPALPASPEPTSHRTPAALPSPPSTSSPPAARIRTRSSCWACIRRRQPPSLANNFQGYVPIEDKNTNTWDIRIDANISPKDILFGVYDRSLLTADVPSYFPGVAVGPERRTQRQPARLRLGGRLYAHPHSHAHQRHARGHGAQRQVASVRLGQRLRKRSLFGNRDPGPGTCNIPLEYGIQGVPQVANNGGLPVINIGGLSGTWRRQLHAHAAIRLEPRGRGRGHQGLPQPRLQDRNPGGRSGRQHLAAAARPRRLQLQRHVYRCSQPHLQTRHRPERHRRSTGGAHQLRIRRGQRRQHVAA